MKYLRNNDIAEGRETKIQLENYRGRKGWYWFFNNGWTYAHLKNTHQTLIQENFKPSAYAKLFW